MTFQETERLRNKWFSWRIMGYRWPTSPCHDITWHNCCRRRPAHPTALKEATSWCNVMASLVFDSPVTLVVKTPNQKVDDLRIDCALEWSVEQLKRHLSSVYPTKPVKIWLPFTSFEACLCLNRWTLYLFWLVSLLRKASIRESFIQGSYWTII